MKRIELRTPLARAVVPVLAGIAFFVALGLLLWVFAILISNNDDEVTNLAPDEFRVGTADYIADLVAEDGPILFPGLGPGNTDRLIVLDHRGNDPLSGWLVRLGHPADRDATCVVEQVPDTATFTDCDGRSLGVDDLALPEAGVNPFIDTDRKTLWLDLTVDVAEPTADSTPSATTAG